jgi:hypothetical protein
VSDVVTGTSALSERKYVVGTTGGPMLQAKGILAAESPCASSVQLATVQHITQTLNNYAPHCTSQVGNGNTAYQNNGTDAVDAFNAVAAVIARLPANVRDEAAEELEDIKGEAAKPSPRKSTLKALAGSLLQKVPAAAAGTSAVLALMEKLGFKPGDFAIYVKEHIGHAG